MDNREYYSHLRRMGFRCIATISWHGVHAVAQSWDQPGAHNCWARLKTTSAATCRRILGGLSSLRRLRTKAVSCVATNSGPVGKVQRGESNQGRCSGVCTQAPANLSDVCGVAMPAARRAARCRRRVAQRRLQSWLWSRIVFLRLHTAASTGVVAERAQMRRV